MATFTKEKRIDDYQVLTNDGYKDFKGVGKTIPYIVWELYTTKYQLSCADNHILLQALLDENDELIYVEKFVYELLVGDIIVVLDDDNNLTTDMIMVLYETDNTEIMYDLIDVDDSLYITNNIVSHNSTTTICYALWVILFKNHQNLAILANKRELAMELLGRLQLAYENLPLWLQQGVVEWNKSHIELENGSQISAFSTSATSVRGNTYNIVFCDEFAFVPNGIQEEFMTSVYPTISSSKDSKLIITSCVTKDTFILTNKGYTKLEFLIKDELDKKSYYVDEYKSLGMNGYNTGNIIHNNGKADIRKIYTKINQTNCSLTHKFYACKNGVYGWFTSQQLEVGDFIALRYNTQVFGDQDNIDSNLFDKVTPELAYFVGIFVGSGYITDDRFITLALRDTNTNIFIDDRYDDAIKGIGLDYEFDGKHYIIDNSELAAILKSFKHKNPDKYANYGSGFTELPMRWSKPNIVSLLQGIFDSMALYNYQQDPSVRGDIYINSNNEDLLEQVHMLLLNLGVINALKTGIWEQHRYYWHTKRKMRYSPKSTIKISNCYTPDFFATVGFKHPHKVEWSKYQINIRKFRKNIDSIPYLIDFIRPHLTKAQLSKFVRQSRIVEQPHIYHHMSRENALKRCDMLLDYNVPQITDFVALHVRPDITWTKIYKIVDGNQDYVYDLSLPHIPDDPFCHSVLYNGNVGHNTPKGLNLYYKLYIEAQRGKNQYVPVEITWDMIPGRDAKFKRDTIANTSARQFEQEFESLSSCSVVKIQDLEGNDRTVTLGGLYRLLEEQNVLENGVVDVVAEDMP
jgi:hypothetical protein